MNLVTFSSNFWSYYLVLPLEMNEKRWRNDDEQTQFVFNYNSYLLTLNSTFNYAVAAATVLLLLLLTNNTKLILISLLCLLLALVLI